MGYLYLSLRNIYAARYRRVSTDFLVERSHADMGYQVVYRLLVLVWECFIPPTICSIATLVSYGVFAYSVCIFPHSVAQTLIAFLGPVKELGRTDSRRTWKTLCHVPTCVPVWLTLADQQDC